MMNPTTSLVLLALAISAGDAHINNGNFHTFSWTGPFVEFNSNKLLKKITVKELETLFKFSHKLLADRSELIEMAARSGGVIARNQRTSDINLMRYRKFDPIVQTREQTNLVFEAVTRELVRRFNLTSDDVANSLPQLPLKGDVSRASRDTCMQTKHNQEVCNPNSRFRTQNGQCNNLDNPDWGAAMVCQRRLLEASYIGHSGYRRAISGDPLPAPRCLSLNMHNHLNRPNNYVTHMYMFFGQLLDHDIILTPMSTAANNKDIQCCPPERVTHPQCVPILVDRDDPFYSQFGVTCLNFVRSAICPTCAMGHRIQMDQVTTFIDASFVYGNAQNETAALRQNDGTGRLKVQNKNSGDLLPKSFSPHEDNCSFPNTNEICFEAGDPRVNQHTVLTSLHTIFMREHNRIADELRRINTHWNDERIFQESRRIVGAEMQVITYKDYLPITLGKDRMSEFRLWVSDTGTTSYDPEEDPTMLLEFTTAAFRFGHSMINSVVANYPLNATNEPRLLRDDFFQPFDLYNGVIGPLVRGASNSPAQWFDKYLVPDITNYLYRLRGDRTGLDLPATNINRGRDHGIPPYVNMVRFCSNGLNVIKSFNDLIINGIMEDEDVNVLRRNYQNVADVDLWPGILMEIPENDAVVGPTAACIIGLQFKKMKFGDRFYFEHRRQAGSFTFRQMQELRKTALSHIICLNTDANQMPSNAMLLSSSNNPNINCTCVRGVNLAYWREQNEEKEVIEDET